MMTSLWSAASGMMAQELNMDIISNNLANTDTNGFKKSRVEFQDLLYQTNVVPGALNSQGVNRPTGIQIGNGVKPVAVQKIMTPGEVINTGNQMDISIQGDGFIQLLLPDGTTAYTRNGALKVDQNGQLVTSEGFLIEPAMTLPTDYRDVMIGSDGTVSVTVSSSNDVQEVGRLELVRFANPGGLINIGQNLMKETPASGTPQVGTAGTNGIGGIAQNTLEASNVKVVEEMIKMITAQRAYEVNTKSIQTADSMLQMANNIKR